MSLRDQLQKSGLLSKEKLKRAERAVSKSQHKKDLEERSKRSDEGFIKSELQVAEELRLDLEALDRAQDKRETEIAEAQVLAIITRGELKDPTAKGTYYFTLSNGQIEQIVVNEIQSLQLAAGECAIAFLPAEGRYVLISRKNAKKILSLQPSLIACFHNPTAAGGSS